MKTIFYIRHGETEANKAGLTAGGELESPLTEKGREQAKRAGKDLQKHGIELMVCSPMQRTVDTARIIANEIGYNPDKIVKKQEFIERNVGQFSNRPHHEYVAVMQENTDPDGVESTQEMVARVKRGFGWIREQKAQRVAIVAHGGVSRIVRVLSENLPVSDIYKIDNFKNCEVYQFTLE